ncbi:MAG: VOC family protein [Verrucomicrobiales bacterium]|nr:VOC family protein [Verrucomicrobiales bacterium]
MMLHAIPGLPVSDMERSAAFYRDKLGFTVAFQKPGFTKLRRDAVEIHLWVANDESWRTRGGSEPVVSGAESFIAGTSGCRIGVAGVDELYRVIQPLGILHPRGQIEDMPWGTREFGVLDPDHNLITFFERR